MRKIAIAILTSVVFVFGFPGVVAANLLPRLESQFRELVDARTPESEINRHLELLDEVMVRIRGHYVEDVDIDHLEDAGIAGILKIGASPRAADPDQLFAAAAEGMLASLDIHSSYLSPQRFAEMKTQSSGRFAGVGVNVTMEEGRLKVVTPLDGTPAARAGIQPGDIVTRIDGEPLAGWSLIKIVGRMRGDEGSRIVLNLERGGRSLQVSLIREMIVLNTVTWRREGEVGYIRITAFSEGVGAKVASALRALTAQSPTGLVLDLRSNPGGLQSEAVATADQFIDSGDISILRGRTGGDQVSRATPGDLSRGLPLAVLIDGGSASGAELVATSLRSLRRAVLIGERSFGKGSVQTIAPLGNGGAVRLTTARYFSDLGTTFDGSGLDPDIVVDKGPKDGPDRILERAVAKLTGRSQPVASVGTRAQSTAQKYPRHSPVSGFREGAPRRDDIAVIIGNADYSRLGVDLPDVVPAYADAEGVKRYVLKSLGVREGNIIDLRDATGAQLLRVFGSETDHRGQLFDWVRPGRSRVFVYYAGHGAPGGDDGGAYLVPADADGSRIRLNGYRLETLYRNLGKLPAESVTVVLEACFSGVSQSGAVVPRSSGIYLRQREPPIPAKVTVISAGAADQVASWEQDSSHSLFTEYFLTGMAGEADGPPYGNGDGTVSTAELGAYLKDTVTYYARRYYGRDQTVQIVAGAKR